MTAVTNSFDTNFYINNFSALVIKHDQSKFKEERTYYSLLLQRDKSQSRQNRSMVKGQAKWQEQKVERAHIYS